YFAAFRNATNIGGNDAYFDMTIGQKFLEEWRRMKTGDIRDHNNAAYRVTGDIKRIFEFEELDINTSDKAQTLNLRIDGNVFRLDEVGSGIAQFILVLATAAISSPEYILIDEPEQNLHPTLQL